MLALGCALDARYDSVIRAMRAAVIRSAENPVMLAALDVCHAEADDAVAARAVLRRLEPRSTAHRLDYRSGLVHASLGAAARASHYLERARSRRGIDPTTTSAPRLAV